MATTIEIDLHSMQCESVPEISQLRGGAGAYCLEPKWDGFRLVCHVTRDSTGPRVHSYTRELKCQDGKLPYVDEELLAIFPDGTVVDGEIVATVQNDDGTVRNDFEHVQSVMLSKPERAVQRALEVRPLDYMIFDIMYYGGKDIRSLALWQRKEILEKHLLGQATERLILGACVHPATQDLHERWVAMGFEGTVAKLWDGTYQSDTRGKGWFKLKPQKTIDAVIVGFLPGEGKYHDTIGSIVFAQPTDDQGLLDKSWSFQREIEAKGGVVKFPLDGRKWAIRGTSSGMTDEIRYKIGRDRARYIARVVEMKHMGLMAGKLKFRHPQFNRFRDEKPLADVTWHDR